MLSFCGYFLLFFLFLCCLSCSETNFAKKRFQTEYNRFVKIVLFFHFILFHSFSLFDSFNCFSFYFFFRLSWFCWISKLFIEQKVPTSKYFSDVFCPATDTFRRDKPIIGINFLKCCFMRRSIQFKSTCILRSSASLLWPLSVQSHKMKMDRRVNLCPIQYAHRRFLFWLFDNIKWQ